MAGITGTFGRNSSQPSLELESRSIVARIKEIKSPDDYPTKVVVGQPHRKFSNVFALMDQSS